MSFRFGYNKFQSSSSHPKDTSGQEKFGSALTAGYYRSAKGCLLVYSIDSSSSFKNLSKWLIELDRYTTEPQFVKVCVGNKLDLAYMREVSHKEAEAFTKQFGIDWLEVSAKENTNIEEAFQLLIKNILKIQSPESIQEVPPVRLNGSTVTKSEGEQDGACC